MQNIEDFSGKKTGEWAIRALGRRKKKRKKKKEREDQKSNGSRQNIKTGESKLESVDSPEIPDRMETSDIPGLPFGSGKWQGTGMRTGSGNESAAMASVLSIPC